MDPARRSVNPAPPLGRCAQSRSGSGLLRLIGIESENLGVGHALVKRAANRQPMAIFVAVSGKTRGFRQVAGAVGSAHAVAGKMPERQAQKRITRQARIGIIGCGAQPRAGQNPRNNGAFTTTGCRETNGHGAGAPFKMATGRGRLEPCFSPKALSLGVAGWLSKPCISLRFWLGSVFSQGCALAPPSSGAISPRAGGYCGSLIQLPLP